MSGSRIARAPREGSSASWLEHEAGLLERAEVRDVLAWMRLLVDPQDAAAIVRALSRPPVELRQVDLARVIQLARRRKLDLVLGLAAATESPHVPPEARERIERFVELHRGAAADMDSLPPDAFISGLIQRLQLRAQRLLGPQDGAEHASLERLRSLAAEFARANPRASVRELTIQLSAALPGSRRQRREPGAVLAPAPLPAPAREPDAPSAQGAAPPAMPPAEPEAAVGALEQMLQALREEVLLGVGRIGGRLGELRLDTDLDISHGVVRYLELLKLSALLQHPGGQSRAEALADINARLLAATTPTQREIFETSPLDETLLAHADDERARAHAIAPRGEPSLGPFLPRRGGGLALSASDIQTYRSCPLRYKFARVLRIPVEQTPQQRFGIVVHQVLERYHSEGGSALAQLLALLDASWRRAGLGDDERHRDLRNKARAALTRYHARLHDRDAEPVWFERQFDFRLGPHHLRGRVDRVDRLSGQGDAFELIDYKTSRPKTAEELAGDVQLSLYALAAREAWQLESSRQAYYYVLDDLKVPVPRSEHDTAAVDDIVLAVGEGILAQAFEPTPSHAACSLCDYRIVCPAAER